MPQNITNQLPESKKQSILTNCQRHKGKPVVLSVQAGVNLYSTSDGWVHGCYISLKIAATTATVSH